jgi:hypothetical protein
MAKNDDGFNLDDMMEIFGDSADLPAKKEEAPSRPAVATQEAPKPSAAVAEDISDDEAAILAAYEKSKKEKQNRDEEARRKKELEAQKILEQYENELRQAKEREAKLRKELEDRQKKELEALKKKDEFRVDEAKKAEEERAIIEEFERQNREQRDKEEAAKRLQEEKAQLELKALAEKQKAEEVQRQAEESRREAEFKAKAAAQVGDKKENRLMELLAKAQADLEKAAPVPLPQAAAATVSSTAAAPGGDRSSLKDVMLDIEAKENEQFVIMLDETRKSMFTFLAPMIGIKAATNMLNKTVEKVRSVAPVLFKDANWKMDGTLREDGSVDPERMLNNVQKIGVATRVDDYVNGLHALVTMRIKSVEAGLGAKAGMDMKMKLADLRRTFGDKGVKPDWIDIFYSHVIS